MLIKNLSQVIILNGALIFSTSTMAMEDLRVHDESSVPSSFSSTYVMADRESKELKELQKNIAKDQSQFFINDKFECLSCCGYLTAVKWILSTECPIKPNQNGMNMAFAFAAQCDQRQVVEFLQNLPAGQLRPDQEAVNWALIKSALKCENTMVDWLLSQPDGKLKPDQQSINMAYDEVSDNVCYIAPEDPRNSLMNETIAILFSHLQIPQ